MQDRCAECKSDEVVIRDIKKRGILFFFLINPVLCILLSYTFDWVLDFNTTFIFFIQFVFYECIALFYIFRKKRFAISCNKCGNTVYTE